MESMVVVYDSLKNKDGTLNELNVFELVKKYVKLQNNAEQIYDKISKGLLSGTHYSAETVISVFESVQKDLVDRNQVCEDMLTLVSDEETKQLILEYFGKLY